MADGGRWRLSMMMALIYAVQGAWWPLLSIHLRDLGIEGRGRGWIFATMALASLATPLGAGQLADRRVATQRLLAMLYGLGALLLAGLALGVTTRFGPLFLLCLVYWLVVAPGYGLSNSLAFRNLERPAEQFGGVRMWGTVGWMAVGWVVSAVMAWRGSADPGEGAYEAFWVAAVASAIFSAYCLTLPHTPPLGREARGVELGEAAELLRRPDVATFLLTAFGVSLTTPFIYQAVPPYLPTLGLPRAWVASAMTLGQVLEVAMLWALPWFLRRLGTRWALTVGIGAWVGYFGIMAAHPPLWVALLGIPLNGVAIALFHVAGPMFLDGQAPADRRASVQGLYLVVTSGLGQLLGNLLAGEIIGRFGGIGPRVFLAPCLIDALLLVAFARYFRMPALGREPGLGRSGVRAVGATPRAAVATARP